MLFLLREPGYTLAVLIATDSKYDFDLDLLQDLLTTLDGNLARIKKAERETRDPDSWGIYDAADYTIGIAMVACQAYITAIRGSANVSLPAALAKGPRNDRGSWRQTSASAVQ